MIPAMSSESSLAHSSSQRDLSQISAWLEAQGRREEDSPLLVRFALHRTRKEDALEGPRFGHGQALDLFGEEVPLFIGIGRQAGVAQALGHHKAPPQIVPQPGRKDHPPLGIDVVAELPDEHLLTPFVVFRAFFHHFSPLEPIIGPVPSKIKGRARFFGMFTFPIVS